MVASAMIMRLENSLATLVVEMRGERRHRDRLSHRVDDLEAQTRPPEGPEP